MLTLRLFVAAALIACAPGWTSAAPPALSSYWPHEDGRHWPYAQHAEEFYPDHQTEDTSAELYFDGTTTAPVGIAAQLLKGYVTAPNPPSRWAASMPDIIADPWLRNLWFARPDLRDAITDLVSSADQPCLSNGIPGWSAVLITGGLAYVQTVDEIAAWRCDLANTKAWLWLTSNLTPGHVESMQLIPDLADDVYLYVTIGGIESATVPAGTFANALRVDYKIDYGESTCGDPYGTTRFETNGYVRYAPGVGPIESYEEFENFLVSGTPCPGQPPTGTPIAIYTLKLASASVPAHAASWGGVKAAYR